MVAWADYKEDAKSRGALALELYVATSTPAGKPEDVKASLPAHLAYQAELERAGALAFAGPMSDESGEHMQGVGMIVYRAESLEAARVLAGLCYQNLAAVLVVAGREGAGGDGGDQGQGYNQGGQQGEGDRQGQLAQQVLVVAADEDDGQEHQGGGQGRGDDGAADLGAAGAGRAIVALLGVGRRLTAGGVVIIAAVASVLR